MGRLKDLGFTIAKNYKDGHNHVVVICEKRNDMFRWCNEFEDKWAKRFEIYEAKGKIQRFSK